jgi:hypothetical protein
MINHFQLGAALAALGEREDSLQILQDGLEAVPGDLAESQVALLRTKMQALIKDLEKGPETRA